VWPDVPTRFLLCRDDRLFPAEFMRRVVRERLGITPDEIDGSHCVALSRPRELADRMEAYLAERTAPGRRVAAGRPERYERFVALIMALFVEALLDAAEVGPGDAVLDLACGMGFTARAAAARVGPTGRVVGADIDPGMLRVAAARSAAEGRTIGWHQASADDLPFREAEFDAVVCQQGLQFFPDPRAAVTEAARVTRKGGRVGATVWSPLERSPYFQALFRAVERIVGARASSLFDDAFGCSPELATAAFRAAGLGEVQAREVVADIRLPSIVEFVPGHLTASRWGAAGADARPDGVELATASMVELLAGRTAPDGSVTVPLASLLVTGRR
jgi:SAM-dependent methyltransferase